MQKLTVQNCKARSIESPNNSSSPLRIRVSNLLLPVYKGNPKHVFMGAFEREIRVNLVFLL